MSILNWNEIASNEGLIIFCLIFAVVRIYFEIIGFDFGKLPITKALGERSGQDQLKKFHKSGLYLSVGYILFFAPGILLS
jgi:hypothetical protein